MQHKFIFKDRSPYLFLWFAGWGMDDRPFRKYLPLGADFLVCYDYRDLVFDFSLLESYDAVTVAGWSMGVWAASQVFNEKKCRIKRSLAVNGTNFPIDTQKGIAPSIFKGTVEGIQVDGNYRKFLLRMCGSLSAYQAFTHLAPHRSLQELQEELVCIGQSALQLPVSSFVWDYAFIGSQDRIIPPNCQRNAFQAPTQIEIRQTPHYSESLFREIIEEIAFKK